MDVNLARGKLARKNKKVVLTVASAFFVLALLASLLAPSEESLGKLVRLIYIHTAFSWVGLVGFSLSALLGAAYILTRQKWQFFWSVALQRTALGLWFIHFLLGFMAMVYVWGGIVWNEPRLFFTTIVFLVGLLVYLVSKLTPKSLVISGMNVALGVGIGALLVRTGRVFHPVSPIGKSSDLLVWLYPLATTVLLMVAFGAAAYLAYLRQAEGS